MKFSTSNQTCAQNSRQFIDQKALEQNSFADFLSHELHNSQNGQFKENKPPDLQVSE